MSVPPIWIQVPTSAPTPEEEIRRLRRDLRDAQAQTHRQIAVTLDLLNALDAAQLALSKYEIQAAVLRADVERLKQEAERGVRVNALCYHCSAVVRLMPGPEGVA